MEVNIKSRDTLLFRLQGTKISVENEASCYYPEVYLLKYDTRVLSSTASAIIYPLLFLFNYNMALLDVIFPHLCLSLANEKVK